MRGLTDIQQGRSDFAKEAQPLGYEQALQDVEAVAKDMFALDITSQAQIRWVLDAVRGLR